MPALPGPAGRGDRGRGGRRTPSPWPSWPPSWRRSGSRPSCWWSPPAAAARRPAWSPARWPEATGGGSWGRRSAGRSPSAPPGCWRSPAGPPPSSACPPRPPAEVEVHDVRGPGYGIASIEGDAGGRPGRRHRGAAARPGLHGQGARPAGPPGRRGRRRPARVLAHRRDARRPRAAGREWTVQRSVTGPPEGSREPQSGCPNWTIGGGARAGAGRRGLRPRGRRRPAAPRRAQPGRPRARARPARPRGDAGGARPPPARPAARRSSEMPADEFPYDPAFGEPYNCRERFFAERLGDDAGWLHAGRPRREAVRIALRLQLRGLVVELAADAAGSPTPSAGQAVAHAETSCPTRPTSSTPSRRRSVTTCWPSPTRCCATRSGCSTGWTGSTAARAAPGCVNGSRLLDDRTRVAGLLGFHGVIEHTRDAMWQIDGLIDLLATAVSLVTNQSKLAEDLEIWASQEFDFVDLADPLHPLQRAHAAETQPVRAVHHPGCGRGPDRPPLRLPGRREEPVGTQRQHDLRLRRGPSRPRARAARSPGSWPGWWPPSTCKPSGCSRACATGSPRPPTWPSTSCRPPGSTTERPTWWSAGRCARPGGKASAGSTSPARCWTRPRGRSWAGRSGWPGATSARSSTRGRSCSPGRRRRRRASGGPADGRRVLPGRRRAGSRRRRPGAGLPRGRGRPAQPGEGGGSWLEGSATRYSSSGCPRRVFET